MTIDKNTIISLKFVNFRPKNYLISYPTFVNLTTYSTSSIRQYPETYYNLYYLYILCIIKI